MSVCFCLFNSTTDILGTALNSWHETGLFPPYDLKKTKFAFPKMVKTRSITKKYLRDRSKGKSIRWIYTTWFFHMTTVKLSLKFVNLFDYYFANKSAKALFASDMRNKNVFREPITLRLKMPLWIVLNGAYFYFKNHINDMRTCAFRERGWYYFSSWNRDAYFILFV